MLVTRGTGRFTSTITSVPSAFVLFPSCTERGQYGPSHQAEPRSNARGGSTARGWVRAASVAQPSHRDPLQQRCIAAATANYVCFPYGKILVLGEINPRFTKSLHFKHMMWPRFLKNCSNPILSFSNLQPPSHH